jgi:hypothetical protein
MKIQLSSFILTGNTIKLNILVLAAASGGRMESKPTYGGPSLSSSPSLMTGADIVLEKSVYSPFNPLTRLLARTYSPEFSRCDSFKLHND